MSDKIKRGSGNVFRDLEFDNPNEYQVKAELAVHIIAIINDRSLTQKQAAGIIGASQPDLSKLKNGQLTGFTLDRLFSFLLRLNRNIEIRVTKTKAKGILGKIAAIAA